MAYRTLRTGASTALLFALLGCADDPFERPGTWQPAGMNDRNLSLMVANPGDLARGVGAQSDRGDAGATAVTRLVTEQRRPLLASPSSTVGGSQQPTADRPIPGLGVASGSRGGR